MFKPIQSSRTADKFVIRMPDGMREEIQEHARAEHISANSFIIRALTATLTGEQPSLQLPKTSWTPQRGMLVVTPEVDHPLEIIGFMFDETSDKLTLELGDTRHKHDRTFVLAEDVRPYWV